MRARPGLDQKVRTIGIATEGGAPMYLPSIHASLNGVSSSDAYNYAAPSGRPELRELWRKKLERENPSLNVRRWLSCSADVGA